MSYAKKILSVVLIVALCMCLGTTAFAAEEMTEDISVTLEEIQVYDDVESVNAIGINPLADNRVFYEFSEGNWCPSLGAYGAKAKATASGTLRVTIGAVCRNPDGVHSGEQIQVKITSGIVTLATINVPVDGKVRTYRFNGVDNKKVNIVKGNNYTTKITGSKDCLLMVISGYVAARV